MISQFSLTDIELWTHSFETTKWISLYIQSVLKNKQTLTTITSGLDVLLLFYLFETRLNRSSLIATKVKTNMRLVPIKLSLLSALFNVPLFKLVPHTQQ